jgi:putative membrane protein
MKTDARKHVVWWLVLIVAILAIIRWTARSGPHGAPPTQEDRAIAILRERYARGEIDKAEFEERKRDLGG